MPTDTSAALNSFKSFPGAVSRSAMLLLVLALMPAAVTNPAGAATPGEMMALCRNRAHDVLKIRLPDIDTKYEGQRVDGTHAVNGTATASGKSTTFQCSFNKAGSGIIRFVVNKPQADAGGGGGTGAFNATGNINCAEFAGQPFKACKFGVVRRGNGSATVTVFLSKGVKRTIDFKNGAAVATNSNAALVSARKSDLITVTIGTNERYEMPDAVINGG